MRIVYFLGVKNQEEIRKTYKKLSMQLHPDRNGDQEKFVEMKQEYDWLVSNYQSLSFPLKAHTREYNPTSGADLFEEMMKRNRSSHNASDFAHQAAAREFRRAEQARRDNYANQFAQARQQDPYYDVLDQVIDRKIAASESNIWVMKQLRKLDDLELIHFKYVAMRLEYKIAWAHFKYQEYLEYKKFGEQLFRN